MKTETQNNNKFVLNDSSLKDAARLTELVTKFLKGKSAVENEEALNDPSILFGGEMIEAIFNCLKSCTFNDEVISEEVFNKNKDFRKDYVEIATLVIKHNTEGFFTEKKSIS